VKTVLIVAKILPLLAASFALLMLGMLLHRFEVLDFTAVLSKLGTMIQAATDELEAAHQTTVDVDSGVSYEVAELKRPTPLIFKILKTVAQGFGSAVKL
jgi:hypothetical protein